MNSIYGGQLIMHLCVLYYIFLFPSVSIFHSRFASVCIYATSFSDCETSFQMEIMNVGGVDDKNTYVSQGVVLCGDHIVCAYTRTIIAYGERVRQIESMTSCQSWNGNLVAKRGTSQLPATANNLGRSRSSSIHEHISISRR